MTNPSFMVDRFVGDTVTCFSDLINKYPGLRVHELLAEFCGRPDVPKERVTVETVQHWQRGKYMPGGLQLVQLRCFLQLAGYDVTELKQLAGDPQMLAFGLALRILDPVEAEEAMEYTPNALQAIWDITIRGREYGAHRSVLLRQYLSRRKKTAIRALQEEWRSRIADVLVSLGAEQPSPIPVIHTVVDPGIPAAFAHLVGATAALGNTLLSKPDLRAAVLGATHAGADLAGLIETLQQFLPVQPPD